MNNNMSTPAALDLMQKQFTAMSNWFELSKRISSFKSDVIIKNYDFLYLCEKVIEDTVSFRELCLQSNWIETFCVSEIEINIEKEDVHVTLEIVSIKTDGQVYEIGLMENINNDITDFEERWQDFTYRIDKMIFNAKEYCSEYLKQRVNHIEVYGSELGKQRIKELV